MNFLTRNRFIVAIVVITTPLTAATKITENSNKAFETYLQQQLPKLAGLAQVDGVVGIIKCHVLMDLLKTNKERWINSVVNPLGTNRIQLLTLILNTLAQEPACAKDFLPALFKYVPDVAYYNPVALLRIINQLATRRFARYANLNAETQPLIGELCYIDEQGQQLVQAASQGNVERIQQLLDEGAYIDVGRKIDHRHITPLGAAVEANQLEAAQLLIDRGANKKEFSYDIHLDHTWGWHTYGRQTPLQIALNGDNNAMLHLLVGNDELTVEDATYILHREKAIETVNVLPLLRAIVGINIDPGLVEKAKRRIEQEQKQEQRRIEDDKPLKSTLKDIARQITFKIGNPANIASKD